MQCCPPGMSSGCRLYCHLNTEGLPYSIPNYHIFVIQEQPVQKGSTVFGVSCCVPHTAGPRFPFVHILVNRMRIIAAHEAAGYSTGAQQTGKIVCKSGGMERHTCSTQTRTSVQSQIGSCYSVHVLQLGAFSSITYFLYTGGNLADTGSLELPQWNPPASWSLP